MSGDVLLALALVLSQGAEPGATPHPPAATPPTLLAPPPTPAASAKTPAPPPEHIRSFETDHAFVAWSFQGWKVSADGATIKDFGRSESEARRRCA